MELQEAPVNNNKRAEVGTVSHKSSWDDAHIKKLLTYVSKSSGKSEQEIKDAVQKEIDELKGLEQKSPILYSTMAANAVEVGLSKYFDEHVTNPEGAAKFSPVVFSALMRRVKAENPSFFPLRNFFNRKPIASPRIILTPATRKEDLKYNDVDTAAATPNGEFIFNVPFMQKAMNFAYAKGMKPKSAKYNSMVWRFHHNHPVKYRIVACLNQLAHQSVRITRLPPILTTGQNTTTIYRLIAVTIIPA
jgi:hypothetical protein